MRQPAPGARRSTPNRRQFLIGGAVAGAGAVAAVGADALIRSGAAPAPDASAAREPLHGSETVAFHGKHQAGIAIAPQAHATYLALDLLPGAGPDSLRRLMRVLSDDAARLTAGAPPLADSEPELAAAPARLTVTFGFGPGFVAAARSVAPGWLRPLPAFTIDRLEDAYSHGDLLIEIAANDPMTIAHAARMLLKDARSHASVRWSQTGFRRARGTEHSATTVRNLFGQVDGTVNPQPGTDDFDRVVWIRDGWLADGTSFVLRRIRMDLEGWDRLDRSGREQSTGRFLATGAPLTGRREHDEPDFAAKNAIGFPVIPEFSHMRRARSDNRAERIFRRGYSYDAPPAPGETSNSGLLFGSFQADVDAQFVPLQRRLAELDLLNEWTTPIGSAVFAIPPGCAADGYIGDTLLA